MTALRARIGASRACVALTILLAGILSVTGPAAANRSEEPRLRTLDYSPDSVLSLTGFVGYHIHFEFAPDERFVTLGAGDSSVVDVGAESNHLLLKPKQATSGTNLTILTNRRSYFIEFRAFARAPRPGEVVYSVTFRYPAPNPSGNAVSEADSSAALHALPATVNRNYWFCGNEALRPATVDDDGVQIRLRFQPHTDLPAIYASAPDGAETLVNSNIENDTVVVHRLVERLVLRRGRLVGCVVNRSMGRPARRAESGTVHPQIERATREIEP